MNLTYKVYVNRAENELKLAQIIMHISESSKLQEEVFHMSKDTYFSAVITHAYYSIFYSAKAYLLKKEITCKAPQEHRKTYEAFEELVKQGIIDVELLKIYKQVIIKADSLLDIFSQEKNKRGKFTYRSLAQANKDPAKESIEHAKMFFKHMYQLM